MGGAVHALLLDPPREGQVVIEGIASHGGEATLLATGDALAVSSTGGDLALRLPERRPDEPVHMIRLGHAVRPR